MPLDCRQNSKPLKRKRCAITLCALLVSGVSAINNVGAAAFDIYLVRHAEKMANQSDPELTRCGQQRARQWAQVLPVAELDAIYSSDYRRTQQTAATSAKLTDVNVTSYDPRQLEPFAKRLLNQQQTALVVGHSNTTAALAGLLANQSLPHLKESQFDQLFQVHVDTSTNEPQITLKQSSQGFHCQRLD